MCIGVLRAYWVRMYVCTYVHAFAVGGMNLAKPCAVPNYASGVCWHESALEAPPPAPPLRNGCLVPPPVRSSVRQWRHLS